MSFGLTVPKKHLHSIESFCENNDISYDFWNMMSLHLDEAGELLFKNSQERDRASAFLDRLLKLDNQ